MPATLFYIPLLPIVLAKLDTNGPTGETEFLMDISTLPLIPRESERRRGTASGAPIRLSNDEEWLFSKLSVTQFPESLTTPRIDAELDSIFESLTLDGNVKLKDLWLIGRLLIQANYVLTNEEVSFLFELKPGTETQEFAAKILDLVLILRIKTRTFIDWIRASLIANSISPSLLTFRDLPHVLDILVATKRTIPLTEFADVCLHAQQCVNLDSLV